MTEREKIIKVIDEWANKAVKANKFDGASVYNPHNAAELADTLIAAGIGDVSEYKEKLKLHRVFVRKDGGDIKVLYGNNEVDEIVKERNEYKHRAEVAEKAFSNCLENFLKFQYEKNCCLLDKFFLEEVNKKCLQQAEKELAEGKKDKGEVKE